MLLPIPMARVRMIDKGVNDMSLDTLEVFGTEYTNVAGFKATDDNDQIKTYIRPQGTISISANGTGIDVSQYASADVAVPETKFIVTLSWDTTQQKWLPDCTMADLWGAFLAGKTISVSATDISDVITADGFWSDDEVFVYFVHAYTNPGGINATQWYAYVWTPSGITLHDDELYIQPSGSETKTANGTYDVTNLATLVVNVTGTSKNAQAVQSTTRVTSTALSACSGEITVAKTGTYDVYWSTHRTSTSGSWSSQLYVNSAASGTEQTGGWSNHVQPIHLSNVSLTQGQKIRVYAKSRGSNYYAYVPLLTIIES